MKITNIAATRDELKAKLLPLLLNKVFHVTGKESFEKIIESGTINPNINEAYPYTFPQSANNFGVRNEMVCLIDLRLKSYFDAERYARDGYYFLRPRDWETVVFLLLDSSFHKDLKLQARFEPALVGENYIPMEEVYKGTYIPEIECWYPAKITLNKISEVLIVSIAQG